MTITASLSSSTLTVAPGRAAGCDVEITNTGDTTETVRVAVLGNPARWLVPFAPDIVVPNGACRRIRLVFAIPCAPPPPPGRLGFTVRVGGHDLPGALQVPDVRDAQVSITPLISR